MIGRRGEYERNDWKDVVVVYKGGKDSKVYIQGRSSLVLEK